MTSFNAPSQSESRYGNITQMVALLLLQLVKHCMGSWNIRVAKAIAKTNDHNPSSAFEIFEAHLRN